MEREGKKNPTQDHGVIVAGKKCKDKRNQHLITMKPSPKI